MDPLAHIDRMVEMVESARSVPMSVSCVISREALLAALSALRADYPSELAAARDVLQHRDEVIATGQQEADQIVADAQEERIRLIAKHEMVAEAEREAARVQQENKVATAALRDETNQLCETALANIEQLLRRTLSSVERGHDRMRAVADLPAQGLIPGADLSP
ncbi:MAG: hypothetical protein DLM55_00395 [Acidimicrobiales bacterium]|nr:MAG: hypothetical protein DLM55_00395 [Acidimicrobiales bacterium]